MGRLLVAVASDDKKTVGWGHFAHNSYYIIAEVGDGSYSVREVRKNPFSMVPDVDDPGASEKAGETPLEYEELMHMHGIEKYSTLKKMVLDDVDVVVASGGCATSIAYFSSEGVKLVFAPAGEQADKVLEDLSKVDPQSLPPLSQYEKGKFEG